MRHLILRLTPGFTESGSVVRLLGAATLLPLLSAVPFLTSLLGDVAAFALVTLLTVAVVLYVGHASPGGASPHSFRRVALPVGAGAAGVLLIGWTGSQWLDAVLHQPLDAYRGDMLVVIQQGLHRLSLGRNPYTIYSIPWDAPLPYGPVLWAPFAIPAALRVDIRVVTLIGQLFFPALVTVAAVRLARDGRAATAAGALALAAAWMVNPDLGRFVTIGHTPAYWPWIPLFAWLVAEERWTAAAAVLGMLCAARTTMVAIVPVLGMAVWLRDRRRLPWAIGALGLPIAVFYLPFAIWDWRALAYALYGSYQHVIKGFVWTSTDWVQHSVGLAGLLLRAHLGRFVEVTQAVALALTYLTAWRAIRRGAQPAGWMAIALCVFSIGALWPVTYLYFDVALLLASACLAPGIGLSRAISPATSAGTLALLAVVVPVALRAAAPPDAVLDVGEPWARRDLARGFSGDERDADRSFAWVDGREATVWIQRFSTSAARLTITLQPAAIAGGPPQTMTAVLNGFTLGSRTLESGWQDVSFDVRARAATAGINELHLAFQTVVAPREAGTGDDPRRLAAAIDRVRLYSSARLVPSS